MLPGQSGFLLQMFLHIWEEADVARPITILVTNVSAFLGRSGCCLANHDSCYKCFCIFGKKRMLPGQSGFLLQMFLHIWEEADVAWPITILVTNVSAYLGRSRCCLANQDSCCKCFCLLGEKRMLSGQSEFLLKCFCLFRKKRILQACIVLGRPLIRLNINYH